MDDAGVFPLVLRRHDNELLEIVPGARAGANPDSSGLRPCKVWSCDDGETRIYSVSQWADYSVTPIDWRRFAYDHDTVKKLLERCIRDNWASYFGALLNDSLLVRLRTHLEVALKDLSSVFDVQDVTCEQGNEGEVIVNIEGEHKNGRRELYTISL